jgi:Putative Flp pilus-assembly TadE/G-like
MHIFFNRLSHVRAGGSRGQIILMVGLATIVMFGIVGLAVDVGRLYVTRVELGRSLDTAALSGILELNGTPAGLTNAVAKANEYFYDNESNAVPTVSICDGNAGPPCYGETNTLTMNGTKTIKMFFLSILGIKTASVSAHAKAGFGTQFLDAALVIDATGSMSGSPIDNAKSAATSFKNILLGSSPSGNVSVGVTPFRGCFRDNPRSSIAPQTNSSTNCVDYANQTTYLTSNSSLLTTRISNISATGGSGTNVCGGLYMGLDILDGPNNHLAEDGNRRYMVLLSDGDNTYNNYSYNGTNPQSPYTICRPSSTPQTSDGDVSSNCAAAQTREKQIDILTWQLSQSIETQDIEIFVVAFGVCSNTSTVCGDGVCTDVECANQVGNNDHDNTADQRLLKCIASSSAGTNDHYYWASSASELTSIFTAIANQISHRLIE